METPKNETPEKDAETLLTEVFNMGKDLEKAGKGEEFKELAAEFAANLRADALRGIKPSDEPKIGMLKLATEHHAKVTALLAGCDEPKAA